MLTVKWLTSKTLDRKYLIKSKTTQFFFGVINLIIIYNYYLLYDLDLLKTTASALQI